MGENGQHPVADFFLETVHDRQDDDECRYTQCDTGHRYQRDERDETVAATAFSRTDIAQADEPFERQIGKNFQRDTPGKMAQFAIYSVWRHILIACLLALAHGRCRNRKAGMVGDGFSRWKN